MSITRISIELTNECGKGCWFCYNGSAPGKQTQWTADDLVSFTRDCAANGVQAVSFGGGEPLQYLGLFEVLDRLRGVMFRSLTTNGLLLDAAMMERFVHSAPDKVHVSVHFPEREAEVRRVCDQVHELAARSIRSGVNLLVARSKLAAARSASDFLRSHGTGNERIVYLPMRGQDTPSPEELAQVAGGERFQSMTCLKRCGRSERFASVGWDRTVAWCSYTRSRRALTEPTYAAMTQTLSTMSLDFCGGTEQLALSAKALRLGG